MFLLSYNFFFIFFSFDEYADFYFFNFSLNMWRF